MFQGAAFRMEKIRESASRISPPYQRTARQIVILSASDEDTRRISTLALCIGLKVEILRAAKDASLRMTSVPGCGLPDGKKLEEAPRGFWLSYQRTVRQIVILRASDEDARRISTLELCTDL